MFCYIVLFSFYGFRFNYVQTVNRFFQRVTFLNYGFGDIICFLPYFGEWKHRQCTMYENTKMFKIKYVNEYSKFTNVYFIKTSVCAHVCVRAFDSIFHTYKTKNIIRVLCFTFAKSYTKTRRMSGTTSY